MTDFLKCLICNSDTSHSYYGAVCCDPCRMFFRRQVLNPKVRFVFYFPSATNMFFKGPSMYEPRDLCTYVKGKEEMLFLSISKVSHSWHETRNG